MRSSCQQPVEEAKRLAFPHGVAKTVAAVGCFSLAQRCASNSSTLHHARTLRPASGQGVRQIAGRFVPSTSALIRMAQRNDRIRAELIRRLESTPHEVTGPGDLPLDGGALPGARGAVDRQGRLVAQARKVTR